MHCTRVSPIGSGEGHAIPSTPWRGGCDLFIWQEREYSI